jgi:hypothetical protein
MWQNRNNREHQDKATKEIEILQQQVQREIDIGTQNWTSLVPWFTQNELEKIKGNNYIYAKAWLRAVRTIRNREERKAKEGGGLTQMQTFMNRFLQRNK